MSRRRWVVFMVVLAVALLWLLLEATGPVCGCSKFQTDVSTSHR